MLVLSMYTHCHLVKVVEMLELSMHTQSNSLEVLEMLLLNGLRYCVSLVTSAHNVLLVSAHVFLM
jgi:hypothetical protein